MIQGDDGRLGEEKQSYLGSKQTALRGGCRRGTRGQKQRGLVLKISVSGAPERGGGASAEALKDLLTGEKKFEAGGNSRTVAGGQRSSSERRGAAVGPSTTRARRT